MASPAPTPVATVTVLVVDTDYCSDKSGFPRVACSDWFIPAAGIAFAIVWMFFVLSCLASRVRRGLKQQVVRVKDDPFRTTHVKDGHVYSQNWSYDFVLAFGVGSEGVEGVDDSGSYRNESTRAQRKYAREHSFASVLGKLEKGRLETKCFFSQDRSVVFVKIRASLERLCRQAAKEAFKVPLDERRVKAKLSEGVWEADRRRFRWTPKAYSDKLLHKAEDPVWAAANYHRGGDTSQDLLEYMVLRDDSGDSSRLPYRKRRVLARVYPIKDDLGQSPYPYFAYHHGPYNDRSAFDPGGSLYVKDARSGSPFRGVDRLKLLKHILEGDGKDGGCGLDISKMVEHKCVLAAFPLHDEDPCIEMQKTVNVAWRMPWRLDAALVKVKDYHGEKVGIYFTFLASYSTWLFFASFVGVLAFAMVAVEESRTAGTRLGTYRTHGSSLFVTVFAVFVLLWSTAFLEDWKRTQISTAMKWGTRGFEAEERDRPEFLANAANLVINSPVDGRKVVYFPEARRLSRVACSYVVVCSFVVVVIIAIVAVFIFKAFTDPNQCVTAIVRDDDFDDRTGFVPGEIYGKPTMRCAGNGWSSVRVGPYYGVAGVVDVPEIALGSIIATIMVSILIIMFNAIWAKVAAILNAWENHRTDTAFEDALIAKTFAFQVVNSYGALAYIAFIKEPVINRLPFADIYAMCPFGQNSRNMGRSCISELGVQLFSIFVVKLLIDTLQTIAIPFFLDLKCRCCCRDSGNHGDESDDDMGDAEYYYDEPTGEAGAAGGAGGRSVAAGAEAGATGGDGGGVGGVAVRRLKSQVELEYDRPEYHEVLGPFGDYAELAIQFGFATIFTAAFPMAPFMAFLNNHYQVRFDLFKISQLSRRPEPKCAEDIGTWEAIFHAISTVAVVSNCALIVFTGSYFEDYQEWLPFGAVDTNASVQGYKWLVFFSMEHAILLGRMLLALIIEDVPPEIQIQIGRQDMVVSKLIENAESDFEDDEAFHSESDDDLNNQGPEARGIQHGDDDVVLAFHERAEHRARAKWLKKGEK